MKQKTTGRGYRRIYRRVLGTLLLLAITPLVALGWFSLSQINDIYDQKTAAGIEALTNSKLRALDTFIMRATIDMGAITDLLQRAYSGSHADAFIISQEGVLQTDSLYYGRAMEKPNLDLTGIRRGAMLLRQASPDVREITKSGGEVERLPSEVLAVLAPMETMPWVLVVADDTRQSLLPLQSLRVFILFFVLIGCGLIVVGAIASTRRLVDYIMEKDRQQAEIDSRLLQSSKMVALGKMAAGVAHEVNNPLMLIQENAGWITDLLADESPDKMKNYDEIMTSCEKIASNVQRARGITQRMLGFGRRVNPGRAEVMMNVVADHVVELLQSEARSHNVSFVRQYAHDVPVILSDPSQLEQVVLNIIDNAIDAIGKDGTITLTTAPTAAGGVRMRISDTGPGLSPELKARIFDPFFTTKAVGEGTGLGLAICYSILQKLGGTIEVESELGQGTTFTLTMPPEPPDPQTAS